MLQIWKLCDKNKIFGALIANILKAFDCFSHDFFVTWFSNNQMKLNTDKSDLLLNTLEQNVLKIKILTLKILILKNYLVKILTLS